MTIGLLAVGLVLLVVGGEALVRGGASLARGLGVPPLVVGLTFVGFGTSMPELVTSLQAIHADSPGIAIGNVIGSNTANVLLILGLTALIRPIAISPSAFVRDAGVLGVASLLCLWIVANGAVGRGAGGIFVALLVAYVGGTYLVERRRHDASAELHEAEASLAPPVRAGNLGAFLMFAGGLGATILGARCFVEAAIEITRALGVSDAVIGLTLVAVGTSLPELFASTIAAWRGHGELALGNVIGSNIYNVLGILGTTALVHPFEVPKGLELLDVWIMLAATATLLGAIFVLHRLSRATGLAMLAGHVGYVAWLAERGA